MLTITLYNNTSETYKINKVLENAVQITGQLKEETSLITPQFILELHEFPEFNYLYVAEFKRYYFISEITSYRNNLWRVVCIIDPLMSFKDALLSHRAFINRSSQLYNTNIIDEKFPVESTPSYQIVYSSKNKFSHSILPNLTNYGFIVTVTGSSPSLSSIPDTDLQERNGFIIPTNRIINNGIGTTSYLFDSWLSITNFFRKVTADSNLVSQIVSVYYTPISMYRHDGSFVEVTSIPLGNQTVSDITAYLIKTNYLRYDILILDHNILRNYLENDIIFLLREPYSEYDLYLPYYGWYKISSKFLFDNEDKPLTVTLSFDFANGSAQYILSNNDDFVIDVLSIEVFSGVPISFNGIANVLRKEQSLVTEYTAKKESNLSSLIFGSASSLGNTLVGAATLSPSMVLNGANSFLNNTSNYISGEILNEGNLKSQQILNVSSGGACNFKSINNAYFSYPHFLIRRKYLKPLKYQDYIRLNGLINNTVEVLSIFDEGTYLEIGEIFLKISTATSKELDLLRKVLYSGIKI